MLDPIINLLSKYQLTANEWLVFYMLFLGKTDEDCGRWGEMKKWYNNCPHDYLKDTLLSLQKKGLIKADWKAGEKIDPNTVPLNLTVMKMWPRVCGKLGEELWEHYPDWATINGGLAPLKNIGPRYGDPLEFFQYYGRVINNDPELHKKILDIVDWAVENNCLNMSILNFVTSRQWTAYEKLRNNPSFAGIATNICINE